MELKPKPLTGEWEVCHACNGSGQIESYVIDPSEPEDNFNSCLAGFFLSDLKQTHEEQLRQKRFEGDIEAYRPNAGHMRKTLVKCGICDGAGWVRKTDSKFNF